MPDWQNPLSHGDRFGGTSFQPRTTSKPVGMSRAPDKLVASANQPPQQRGDLTGQAARKGNRRRLAGG